MVVHPDDDMAHNVLREQRLDGAPSPEEAREEHRRYLREEGCEVCGEDDPDRLQVVPVFVPSCPAWQSPRNPGMMVLCDEHARSPREIWWAKTVSRARDQGAVAIAVYDCEAVRFAKLPERDWSKEAPGVDSWDDIHPMGRPTPAVAIRCECGAELDEVRYLDGDG